MSVTVATLSIELSRQLADAVAASTTDGKRWSSTLRTAALNSAVSRIIPKVLAFAEENRDVYDVFTELSVAVDVTVGSGGYSLSSLSSPVAVNGFINAEAVIDSARVYGTKRNLSELKFKSNQFMRGSSEYPIYYLEDGKFKWEVDLGDYPVESVFHYIRTHKTMVLSGATGYQTAQLELSDNLQEFVLTGARSEAYRMVDSEAQVASNDKVFDNIAMSVARTSMVNIDQKQGDNK